MITKRIARSKLETYRRDVYRALDEIEQKAVTVGEIADFVRWGVCRETTLHYVRDALRDMATLGIITISTVNQYGWRMRIVQVSKTEQFDKLMVRNPWVA